jgi:hypothetical protein
MHPATKLLPTTTNKTSKGESKDAEDGENTSGGTSSDVSPEPTGSSLFYDTIRAPRAEPTRGPQQT